MLQLTVSRFAVSALLCGGLVACEADTDVVVGVEGAPEAQGSGGIAGPDPTFVHRCAEAAEPVFHLLLADAESGAVLGLERDGTVLARLGAGLLDEPSDLTWGPGGDLFVADFGTSRVHRFDAVRMTEAGVAFFDRDVLEEPMAVRAVGDVLVTLGNDSWNVTVSSLDGELVRSFGDRTLQWPLSMAIDPERGWVFAGRSGTAGDRIERYSLQGGARTAAFAGDVGLGPVRGLAVGCEGSLYASDGEQLLRLSVAGDGTAVATDAWAVEGAARVRRGPDGGIYVLTAAGVQRLDADDELRLAFEVPAGVDARGFEFGALGRGRTFVPTE